MALSLSFTPLASSVQDPPTVLSPSPLTTSSLADLSSLSDAELLAFDDKKLDTLLLEVQAQKNLLDKNLFDLSLQIETNAQTQVILSQDIKIHEAKVSHLRAQEILMARYLYAQPDNLPLLLAQSGSLSGVADTYRSLSIAGLRASNLSHALQTETLLLEQEKEKEKSLGKQYQAVKNDLLSQAQASLNLEDQILRLKNLFKDRKSKILANITKGPAPIIEIITKAFTPLGPDALIWALRISKCESGFNPLAVNASSGAMGLFQFLPSTWRGSPYREQNPFDPTLNATAAAWLYHRSGPNQWECK